LSKDWRSWEAVWSGEKVGRGQRTKGGHPLGLKWRQGDAGIGTCINGEHWNRKDFLVFLMRESSYGLMVLMKVGCA
jgi:hypothetical protein